MDKLSAMPGGQRASPCKKSFFGPCGEHQKLHFYPYSGQKKGSKKGSNADFCTALFNTLSCLQRQLLQINSELKTPANYFDHPSGQYRPMGLTQYGAIGGVCLLAVTKKG